MVISINIFPEFTSLRGVWGCQSCTQKIRAPNFAWDSGLKWKSCWKMSKICPNVGLDFSYWAQKNGKTPYFTTFRGVRGSWLINSKMPGAWFCIRNSADILIFVKNVKDLPTCRTWLLGKEIFFIVLPCWWSCYKGHFLER